MHQWESSHEPNDIASRGPAGEGGGVGRSRTFVRGRLLIGETVRAIRGPRLSEAAGGSRQPREVPGGALEALALEAIRAGKLTVSQARRLLGIPSRYEMDGFLKAHGVFLDLTLEDVRRDSEVARTLPG
jgi:hypothetical protein